MRGMPTRRGQSISGAPESVKSNKKQRFSYEIRIAINPDQFSIAIVIAIRK